MNRRIVLLVCALALAACNGAKTGASTTLTVAVMGSGTVTSFPTGISCPAGCTLQGNVGEQVALFAQPAIGHVLTGWSGATCTGDLCLVTLTADATVVATFGSTAPAPATVTVTVTGPGAITSFPAGISCGTTCTGSFTVGEQVALTAQPNAGATLSSWSASGCSGSICVLTLTGDTALTATFAASQPTPAQVSVTVNGPGTITSFPTGIDCGTTCTATYAVGDAVSLLAQPSAGAVLASWSVTGCSGDLCGLTLTGDTTVTATFAAPATLSVTVGGTGQGTVTSSDAAIDCPSGSCSESLTAGTQVTLTATPTGAYYFLGWFGDGTCTGTKTTCTATLNGTATVKAFFTAINWLSSVTPGLTNTSANALNLWLSDGLGGNQKAVTDYTQTYIDDPFGCPLPTSADGTLLAVGGNVSLDLANTNGPEDNVFLVNAVTGAVSTVTRFERAYANCASISPDGTQVYYVSNYDPSSMSQESTLPDNATQVWASNTDGSSATPITTSIGQGQYLPVLSPDGSKFALQVRLAGSAGSSMVSPWTLWVMGSDGSDAQSITDVYGGDVEYDTPTWSPDSSQFAYASYQSVSDSTQAQMTENVWVYTVAAGTTAPLTNFTGDTAIINPAWSPDGKTIVFSMNAAPGTSVTADSVYLYAVSASGGTPVPLMTSSADNQQAPVWAPDSSVVFFSSVGGNVNGTENIWSVPPDGSTPPAQVTTFTTGQTFTSTLEWD